MSIKDYRKVLCIQNLTNGKIYTINDYYNMPSEVRRGLLFYYLDLVLGFTDNVKIFVTYNDDI